MGRRPEMSPAMDVRKLAPALSCPIPFRRQEFPLARSGLRIGAMKRLPSDMGAKCSPGSPSVRTQMAPIAFAIGSNSPIPRYDVLSHRAIPRKQSRGMQPGSFEFGSSQDAADQDRNL